MGVWEREKEGGCVLHLPGPRAVCVCVCVCVLGWMGAWVAPQDPSKAVSAGAPQPSSFALPLTPPSLPLPFTYPAPPRRTKTPRRVEHPIKGQAVYAYVTLTDASRHDHPDASNVRRALVEHVRQAIGPFAVPDVIHWAPALPKTRSGKIMRRVLRKVASKEEDQLGDVSSLADPSVVEMLIQLRGK